MPILMPRPHTMSLRLSVRQRRMVRATRCKPCGGPCTQRATGRLGRAMEERARKPRHRVRGWRRDSRRMLRFESDEGWRRKPLPAQGGGLSDSHSSLKQKHKNRNRNNLLIGYIGYTLLSLLKRD